MIKKDTTDYEKFLFVMGAKGRERRMSVLKTLNTKKPKTPTQIRKELKCCFNASDRVLKEFETIGIIKCLNPQDKINKKFISRETGEKIKIINYLNQKIFSVQIPSCKLEQIASQIINELEKV